MFRFLWVALLAMSLCAFPGVGRCAANPLSPKQRAELRVEEVRIVWLAEERPVLNAYRQTYDEHRADVATRLGPAVKAAFKDSPSGSKPVAIEIVVTYFGDSPRSIMFLGEAKVIDMADGSTIATYNKLGAFHTMNNNGLIGVLVDKAMKWDDFIGVMVEQFAGKLRKKFDHA